MMKEPVVVAPKFQSFSLHIFSQMSQKVAVKVRVGHSVRRNKFMLNNPLHVAKYSEHALLLNSGPAMPFFALGDCGLFHCDDCCFVSGL
jgi:hypothetical protein